MTLLASNTQFGNEVNLLSQHFRRFAVEKSPLNASASFSLVDECLLEGLLSRLWQAWCVFCRDCVIQSCLGTTTGSGNPVAGLPRRSASRTCLPQRSGRSSETQLFG